MIVILTDFGSSEYVGVMKGVIASINPREQVVDLTHNISPQNILEASWILSQNHKFFPKETIFCCVVDPGVGSKRKPIIVKANDYYFIGPDNGLLWEAVKKERKEYREIRTAKNISKTFHGRDIFAVAAARLSGGNYFEQSRELKDIKKLEIPKNSVVKIDNFGNIITNIGRKKKKNYLLQVNNEQRLLQFYETYKESKKDQLFLIEGSHNTLEISLKNGNANKILNLKTGQILKIT